MAYFWLTEAYFWLTFGLFLSKLKILEYNITY